MAAEGEQKISEIKTESANTAPCSTYADVTLIPF